MRLSTSGKITSVLLAGLALLLVVGGTAVICNRRLADANRLVAHTYQVRAELARALAGVWRAEEGARAVAMSGDTAALADYRAGLAQWDRGLTRASALTAGDAGHRHVLVTVDSLLRERRVLLEALVSLAATGTPERADVARLTRDGRLVTAGIHAAVARLDAVERGLLGERTAAAERTARLTAAALGAVMLLAAVLALLAWRSILSDMAHRRAVERALRDSEQRLQAVFDQTFQFTALLSPTGETLEVNETAASLLGIPASHQVRPPLWAFDWKDEGERARLRRAITDAAGGEFVRLELALRRPDGTLTWLDLSLKPLHTDGPGLTGLVAEARDVTEQRAAETALRRSEARYASILDIAADAIVTADRAQRIVYFNQGAERIFGHAAAEVVGRPLELLLPERLRAGHHGKVERFGASGQVARRMGTREEILALRKDGQEFPAEASISVLETDGERLYTVVLRDVTERARVERERQFLATAGELLGSSLDYGVTLQHVAELAVPILGDACVVDLRDADASVALTIASDDPERRELVREMRRRFPPSPDGPHPLAVAQRTGRPVLLPSLDEALLDATASDVEHRQIVRRLGIRSALFVPLVVRGAVIGVLSSYSTSRALDERDLALALELARRAASAVDNARSYRAARQAAQVRDEVLGIVSHDLRNPISTISMCAEALAARPEPGEVAELAETIQRSTSWMLRVIRDLLDVSAIEAGRLHVDPQPTAAAPILEALEAMHAPQAVDRGVIFGVEAPAAELRFTADAERLVQAVGNLLGNAIKFTPRGGRVTLSVEQRAEAVAFRVRDTGRGIPPAHLPHLFDRFWQARESRRGGAGLGLAIALGIAEAHGGRIEVDSVPDRGSTFTLLLPAAAVAPVAPAVTPRLPGGELFRPAARAATT